MTSSDTIPHYPPTLQNQDATIALFKGLFPCVNPYCEDNKEQFLRGLHHATSGSDDGLALAEDLLSKGDDYPGTDELADKWQSYNNSTEEPVTLDAIRETIESYGFDWIEICSRTEPDFEPCEPVTVHPDGQQPPVQFPVPVNPFDKFSLKGMRSQLLRDAVREVLALDPVALMGQATALYGAPGTGKTLMVLSLLAKTISQGNIDPTKIYYINVDDTHTGLMEKLEFADEYEFHMLAEGHRDFSTDRFLEMLAYLITSNQAKDVIIIFDTMKKVVDLMHKGKCRIFGKLVRPFVMKGGTFIGLAHTNKHRDSDGKPIHAGTSDIVEDFDCAYLMYEVGIDVDAETKTILFENIKSRGNVAKQASYRYSIAENLSYRELLDSVDPIDDTELVAVKQAVELEADAKVIDAITQCIQDGLDVKIRLAEAAARQSGVSKRATLRILDKYCGGDPDKHRWNFKVQERGAKKYHLLNPITTGSDPVK